jgi:phosphatidate phosphatase PAH1
VMGSHKKHRKSSCSSVEGDEEDKSRSKHEKHSSSKSILKKKRLKRKYVSSPSSSSDSSSSDSTSTSSSSTDSEEERRRLKKQKKLKRAQKKNKKLKKIETPQKVEESSADIPLDLMTKAKAMAPMTKAEWEKSQSVVRRVYDESTGRHRLIKGDGEVIEEIVSRDRHMAINRQATRGDGDYFQTKMAGTLKK